jgi:membrane protein required for colicin V production
MSGIDLGIILMVLVSAIIGLFRGLVQEVMSLVSWGGSAAFAFFSFSLVRHISREHIQNPLIADAVTAVALFVVFLIIFSLLSHFLSSVVQKSSLGGVNRSLGAAFGLARGAIILCLMEILMSCFVERPQHPEAVKNSRFSSLIYQSSDAIFQALPASAQLFIRGANKTPVMEMAPLKAVASPITDVAGELMQQQIRQQVGKVISPPPPTEEKKQQQPQKEAESLSNLKTKTQDDTTSANYSKKQRSDMERLLKQD